MLLSVWPRVSMPRTPKSTCSAERAIRRLTWAADSALRCASERTSDATTAKPALARPRGFNGRIERQDIGLEGDAVDDGDDVTISRELASIWRTWVTASLHQRRAGLGRLAHAGRHLVGRIGALQ